MSRRQRRLGEILLEWGVIEAQQLEEALKVAEGSDRRVGHCLIELGYCDDGEVAKALASQFDMEFIDLDQPNPINKENLELIPRDLVRKYLVLPAEKENNRLKVIIHDPMDLELLDNLRFRMNCEIDTAIAARSKLKEFIDRMYSETQSSIDEAIRSMSIDRGASLDLEEGEAGGGSGQSQGGEEVDSNAAPVVRLVNRVLADGIRNGASDIHIEPFADRVQLRYRIDGVCHVMEHIPKRTQAAVIARLKIMAGVKVQEKRIPQDGRIKIRVSKKVYDMRFSTCPCYYGESIVMRILRPEAARMGLEKLGMRESTLNDLNETIRKPNGIFLVTGPTGSGKTTTLYSALDVLNRPDKKIITAEDPVEYNFPGINQCEVNPGLGMTFARILKAMLRQAPNIVLVGEIRDKEVGQVAVEAALTGHLVFSTLHTNDAPSSLTRMIDMGLKPFLVASAVQAVLAQRLVRVLCPECKKPDPKPNRRDLKLCGFTPADLEGGTIWQPVGCSTCGNTGFKGRRGIYEFMKMNSALRELTFKRSPVSQIRKAALDSGMENLLVDGRHKILSGMTTPAEVAKISQVEGVVEDDDEEADEPSAAA